MCQSVDTCPRHVTTAYNHAAMAHAAGGVSRHFRGECGPALIRLGDSAHLEFELAALLCVFVYIYIYILYRGEARAYI